MSNEVADDMKDWPRDLIAFKWAETLSTGEQSVLLTSSLRRLQQAINLSESQPTVVQVQPGRERLVSRDATLCAVTEFCDQFESLGERFKKQLRNAIRSVPIATPSPVPVEQRCVNRACGHAPIDHARGECGVLGCECQRFMAAPKGIDPCRECGCYPVLRQGRATSSPSPDAEKEARKAFEDIAHLARERVNVPASEVYALLEHIDRRVNAALADLSSCSEQVSNKGDRDEQVRGTGS